MARRLIRKRFIIGLVLALLLGLVLTPNPWRDRAAGWGMKKVLHHFLGRPVAWSSLRLIGLPPHLEVRDLEVAPFVRARFVSITPSTTLTASSIYISGLEVDLSGELSGRAPGAPKGHPLRILFLHRLAVADARIKLKETSIPLSGDFHDVSLFTAGERGFLWIRRGALGIQDYPPIELTLRTGFKPDGEALRVEPLVLKGPGLALRGSGRVAGASPYLDLALDLDAPVRPWIHWFGGEIDADARARLKATLRLDDERFLLRGNGDASQAALFGHPLDPFGVEFTIETAGPKRVLDASLKGSQGVLAAHLDLHSPVRIESRLELSQVSLARLLTLFSVPVPAYELPVDARADFAFSGTAIHDGVGALRLEGAEGRLRLDADLRGLGFESFTARLTDAGLDLDAAGSLPFNAVDPVEIRGALHRSDLESVQRFLAPFLPDFGVLSGCAEGDFALGRSFGDPRLEMEARLDGVRLFGLDWGSGPVAFTVTRPEPFAVSRLDLALGGGTIRAAGALAGGFDFQYDDWPWSAPFLMTLSGRGHMDFSPALAIRGEVDRADISVLPVKVDRIHAGFTYDGTTLNLDPLQAWAGDGTFAGEGEFAGAFHLRGGLRDFRIADGVAATGDFQASFGAVLTGRAQVVLSGEGAPFPLDLDADLGDRDGFLRLSTQGYGRLDARLTQEPRGRIAVEGSLEGIQPAGLPVRVEPPVRAAIRLVGDPFDPASWTGGVRVPPFEILQDEFRYRVREELALDLDHGKVTLGRTEIEHDWGFIELSGALQLTEGLPFEADVKADFGDDLVQRLFPDVEYSGFATMDLHAARRERSLELNGELRLDGFYLKVKPIRLILDKPEVRISFQRNRVILDRLEARTGEGRLGAHGEAFLGRKGELLAANVAFDARDLTLRYPEGFRLLLDGDGELVVTRKNSTLSARVTLQDGLYTKDIDLVAELKRALASEQIAPQASRLPDVRLAVEIVIPGTMRFNNQLLDVTGSGRLQIAGTLAHPVVLGALETLPGSRVNFGGVQYQILRATVQFNNPHAFDPSLDLLAEATIQSYLVRLGLSGPLSRLQTQLTSTPYLTEADIFSLLATGAPGRENQQAVATGAASLLVSQQLSQRLSRTTASMLGIDRVRIDPVVGETSLTGARLTLSKQITRDCLFSYTYNSDVNKQDIVALECTVAGNAFLNLMQEDDGSYSLQLMKREKF